jgi:ABC-type Fe3+-hydroxamate transport system substrate-binding protein
VSSPRRWSRRRVLQTCGALPWWAGALASLPACHKDASRAAAETGAPRVASQTVLADEVLWDLGPAVHALVVAVSPMADDPRYSRVVGRWPSAVPRAAGTSEALLALVPTLVVLASFTAPETRRLLEQAGLRTLVLERFDGFSDYRDNVRAIAAAVGAAQDGERVVGEFDARLAALRLEARVRPRVVSWNEGSVPAAGTTFDDAAVAAGWVNLPAQEGRRGHLQVSVEQLVAWDPDAIVVPCGGAFGAEDDEHDDSPAPEQASCTQAAAELATRPGLRATKAAREGAVIGVPSHALYSTGTAMLDVVQRLRDAHPESRS